MIAWAGVPAYKIPERRADVLDLLEILRDALVGNREMHDEICMIAGRKCRWPGVEMMDPQLELERAWPSFGSARETTIDKKFLQTRA